MSTTSSDPRLAGAKQAPKKGISLSWSDPKFRAIVWQVVIVGLIGGLIWYLAHNTIQNLEQRRIATGFAFMDRTAGIPIGEHMIPYDPAVNSYGRAFIVSVLNTLKVTIIGVILTTFLGTFVGIAQLSNNWLLAKISAVYVECMRDVPLLLHLLFWYSILLSLPTVRDAFEIGPGLFLANSGLRMPLLVWQDAHTAALAAFVAGWFGVIFAQKRATRIQNATGLRPAVWPLALAVMVVVPTVVWLLMGAPWEWEIPVKTRFNFRGGGTISPEFMALMIGLVLYHSAFAAEIVRSGILSVPTGQWEAGGALGLRRGVLLRQIVLPQALRVIIPPMTSTYLGVAKNSSLAVAIGYPDVVAIVNTTLNQTGQAIEGIALIMLVYLTISLGISLFMNWYNARIALVER